MLRVTDALDRILAGVPAGGRERVFLSAALGRVLAEDVTAPGDLPPWDNSAMDGFAVRVADVPGRLRVLETVGAGGVPTQPVVPGVATRIMTGAPVPEGAEAIVMVEHTTVDGDDVVVRGSVRPGEHVRRRGHDVRAGTTVMAAGATLTPGRIGLLASLGLPSVAVAARPRVAVISTGDEVVEPGFAIGPGQIHSSNSHALAALVVLAGGEPVDVGNVRDDPVVLRDAFRRAAACDLVVSTGGVSVGDFDHVKGVLGEGLQFWRVAMKPGKPLAWGYVGGKPTFGLPGNPVSCMVNFLQFVRPVIRKMLGDPRPFLPVVPVLLDGTWTRGTGRPEFVRVALRLDGGRLRGTLVGGHQGSGNVASMAGAHGFALVGADVREVAGEVPVQIFDPDFLAAAEPGYTWLGGEGALDGDRC